MASQARRRDKRKPLFPADVRLRRKAGDSPEGLGLICRGKIRAFTRETSRFPAITQELTSRSLLAFSHWPGKIGTFFLAVWRNNPTGQTIVGRWSASSREYGVRREFGSHFLPMG